MGEKTYREKVLDTLVDDPGKGLTSRDLAKKLKTSMSTINGNLRFLEAARLVRRLPELRKPIGRPGHPAIVWVPTAKGRRETAA